MLQTLSSLHGESLPPGLALDLARLRRQLRQAVSSNRLGLGAAGNGSSIASDAAALSQRILAIAAHLDTDLALMLAEPDPGVQQQFVPDARERVSSLVGAPGRLRSESVASGGLRATEARALAVDVDDEATRLHE